MPCVVLPDVCRLCSRVGVFVLYWVSAVLGLSYGITLPSKSVAKCVYQLWPCWVRALPHKSLWYLMLLMGCCWSKGGKHCINDASPVALLNQ
jgi:hypothetical protein